MFEPIFEGSLILFDSTKGQFAEAILFALFPLAFIDVACLLLESSLAMPESLIPLANIVIALNRIEDSIAFSLAIDELSFIDII